jgi:hypothetical protein
MNSTFALDERLNRASLRTSVFESPELFASRRPLCTLNQEMELLTASQILSYGILAAAGVAVGLDFVKARRELSRTMMSWRSVREEVRE